MQGLAAADLKAEKEKDLEEEKKAAVAATAHASLKTLRQKAAAFVA